MNFEELKAKINMQESQIDAILKRVSPLFPKPALPENKSEWNIGHFCLAYLDRVLPRTHLVRPSYIWLLTAHATRVQSPLEESLRATLLETINVCSPRRDMLKQMPLSEVCEFTLNQLRVANCGEVSKVGWDWMRNFDFKAYWVSSAFYSPQFQALTPLDHSFIMFDDREGATTTLPDMFARLNDPHVKICDPWLGMVGTAQEMMKQWANAMLYGSNDAKQVAPIPAGSSFIMHSTLDDKGHYLTHMDALLVGRVTQQNNGEKGVTLLPPQSFGRAVLAYAECQRKLRDGGRK